MNKRLAVFMVALLLAPFAHGQTARRGYGLPAGAFVVETRPLDLGQTRHRALVLWMLRPSKHPRDASDEFYTCPEETRGSYYSGPTRVSLVDTDSRRVLNTVQVREDYIEGQDEFDIPYRIHGGSYYHVGDVPEGQEGRPEIMWLKDYNGDGEALEFALFDAVACMPVETTLIGYSRTQDKVIQYAISVEENEGGKISTEVLYWMDYLFTTKPERPGYWKYEIDYRGRGGSLDRHEIRYDRELERFEGKVSYTTDQ
jgi:hypothetical protein